MSFAEVINDDDVRGLWSTDRTNLAAYVVMMGHEPAAVRWRNGTCHWYFEKTAELLIEASTFIRGEARVEPIAFGAVIRSLNREMQEARRWAPI